MTTIDHKYPFISGCVHGYGFIQIIKTDEEGTVRYKYQIREKSKMERGGWITADYYESTREDIIHSLIWMIVHKGDARTFLFPWQEVK